MTDPSAGFPPPPWFPPNRNPRKPRPPPTGAFLLPEPKPRTCGREPLGAGLSETGFARDVGDDRPREPHGLTDDRHAPLRISKRKWRA